MSTSRQHNPVPEVRAARLLKNKGVWVFPVAVGSLLIMLVTLVYFGSIVDPIAHLHELPVLVVNEDRGAQTSTGKVDLGDQVTSALTSSPQVSTKLALDVTTLAHAEAQMNKNAGYATVVIPAGFTSSVLVLTAAPKPLGPSTPATPLPTIEFLTNSRAGTLGVSLASGVIQPAVSAISKKIGAELVKSTAASSHASAAPKALLEDPVSLSVVQYRPLPPHSGLGLSAFYIALLIMMCGFLGATIVNSSLDAALGYATSEIGPGGASGSLSASPVGRPCSQSGPWRWRLCPSLPASCWRWQPGS